jgi:hypothetical protein
LWPAGGKAREREFSATPEETKAAARVIIEQKPWLRLVVVTK